MWRPATSSTTAAAAPWRVPDRERERQAKHGRSRAVRYPPHPRPPPLPPLLPRPGDRPKLAIPAHSGEKALPGQRPVAAQQRAHLHQPATFCTRSLRNTLRRLNGSVDSWSECWSGASDPRPRGAGRARGTTTVLERATRRGGCSTLAVHQFSLFGHLSANHESRFRVFAEHHRMADLVGRVAVVTGASSGIGEALAKRMAELGAAKIWLVSRRKE